MGSVVNFVTSEPSAIDTDPIQRLKRELGEKRCRAIIDGLIFDVTDALVKIEKSVLANELSDLPGELIRIEDLSMQLGLVCISDVARDLGGCIAANDVPAIRAVANRLIRLSEDSLFTLIEFTDRSIV